MKSGNPVNVADTKLCIPADDTAVSRGISAARGFALAAGLGPDPAARLAIIVEELLFNLVDHAGLAAGAEIELGLAVDAGRIRLTLSDPAPPFDMRLLPTRCALPPTRGGGAGLAMVRAWARVESYARRGDRNVLVLVLPANIGG